MRLRSVRILAALAVASGTAGLAAVGTTTTQAQADPASVTAFAGVGADVTQDLYNAYSGAAPDPGLGAVNQYQPVISSSASGSYTIQSFDASPQGGTTTTPGGITTKAGGPFFDRPNSSGAGTQALEDAVSGTLWENSSGSVTGAGVSVTGQIDFARTAKGVTTTGTLLTWVPFARDALGILTYGTGISSLTTSELQGLYTSATGTEVINGETVSACLPISTASPVTNLVAALGITKTQAEAAATAASCNGTAQNIQQNSGNSFLSAVQAGGITEAVIPISSGSWIGQANGVGFDRSAAARTAGVDLASIDSLGKPYTGTAPSEVPSTTYYQSSTYGYNISTVLPTTKVTGFTANAALKSLFVGSSSVLCSTAAQNIAHEFGFDSLTSGEGTCGSTTLEGDN